MLECCCNIYPLAKTLQVFQTKARSWILQVCTRMVNVTHMSWPSEVSAAVPKSNPMQDL